ncbi:hypothetical protein Tco_0051199 [Tanacetum coccineum]
MRQLSLAHTDGSESSHLRKRTDDNKKEGDDSTRNNHGHQQQPFKRQNVAKVYNMGTGEKKPYGGSLPKRAMGKSRKGMVFLNVSFKTFQVKCPKLKNKDGGNGNAQGWVYAVGNAKKNGKCHRGTRINVVHGFDVIIGMDWLRRCHAMIVCDEKLVRIPYRNETMIFRGNESNDGRESRLAIISSSKAQEYMAKGCQIFLAQIFAKKEEDKSEGKQLKDVPIVQNFPEVFPEDLPGLPPARPVEF